MPYDYHISRAGSQLRSAECPIPRAQWEAAFEGWPRGGELAGEQDAHFFWHGGKVLVYTGRKHLSEIAAFAAQSLGARLLGGDDEEYLPDGTILHEDPHERPDLPARAL